MYAGGMRFAPLEVLLGVVAGAALALTACGAHGQATPPAPHFPTNEDLRHLKALGAPSLSPDGKLVLFTVTEATADGGKSHIWLSSTLGSQQKARQITFSSPSDKRGERGA